MALLYLLKPEEDLLGLVYRVNRREQFNLNEELSSSDRLVMAQRYQLCDT